MAIFRTYTKSMVWWKKMAVVLLSALALIFTLNIVISFWIKKELPKIINENNDSPYHVVYQTIDITLLSGSILLNDITLAPKNAVMVSSVKKGLYATISQIDINGLSIWSFIFNKKIKASSITISKPEIILYKNDDKAVNNPKSINEQVVKPFKNTIAVSDIHLLNASLKIISTTTNLPSLLVNNLTLKIDDVILNDETINNKIPFNFKDFDFLCDSIYFRANEFYHIKADRIASTKSALKIDNLKVIPEYSRTEFVSKIATEKDLYSVDVHSISLFNMNWGFEQEDFFFNASNLVLDKLFANVYRSKIPVDDLSKKPLFSALLRDIPFELQLDTLIMHDANLEYEEEMSVEEGAGSVTFNDFDLLATNINSGFKSADSSEVQIDVNCLFMNIAPMKADWIFNVHDTTDAFTIQGTIFDFPAQQLKPFTKPYLNVAIDGKVDEAYFNFAGDDVLSHGDFGIKYHNLKITVYKNDSPIEKNKLLTVLGNVLVKKDSNLKVKEVEVEVERVQEKSFFNFLWRNVAEGLKKTLL